MGVKRNYFTPLASWLLGELRRANLSARAASLGAGLNHNAISHYIAGNRPSPASCSKLARFFDVPEEFVLELAGHIRRERERDDVFLEQVARLSADWTEDEKQHALELLQTVKRRRRGVQ